MPASTSSVRIAIEMLPLLMTHSFYVRPGCVREIGLVAQFQDAEHKLHAVDRVLVELAAPAPRLARFIRFSAMLAGARGSHD